MFTGIIETVGEVTMLEKSGSNLTIGIESSISAELKVDQSVNHNGVCLTVVDLFNSGHIVTAVAETLSKSNLRDLEKGDKVNLERSMPANGRFDGHIVQGHVDHTGICIEISEKDGSWLFRFEYNLEGRDSNLVVEKGSVCVNGISLTCFDVDRAGFSVAIIPYTYNNTNLHQLKIGDAVNIEFDVIGKYVQKILGSGGTF